MRAFTRVLLIVVLLAVLAVIGGGVWWYGWGPCGRVYIDTAYNQWTDIYHRWAATENRIQSFIGSPRLKDVAGQLWPIRDEMSATVVPACASSVGRSMVQNMDGRLDAYNKSIENPDGAEYFMQIAQAFGIGMDKALSDLEALRGCAPFCGR